MRLKEGTPCPCGEDCVVSYVGGTIPYHRKEEWFYGRCLLLFAYDYPSCLGDP